ncbi:MAG: hypothetical protein QM739_19450 [Propionivibrio sp.]
MKTRLTTKLEKLRANLDCGEFILADARDVDMACGISSPGLYYPPREGGFPYLSMPEFHEQIREVVKQGHVDIMLASVLTMSKLAFGERLFDNSDVTPAIRANDTTDIWIGRGSRCRESPSRPFSSCYIDEVQYDSLSAERTGNPTVNLGLYSVTFNNDLDRDFVTLNAFREFRAEAARKGFRYFLEVFGPNVDTGLPPEEVPFYVIDLICRMLAAVPLSNRPEFLKIPFFGPRALEELVNYDPSLIVGVLGGSSGTTYDAFKLLSEARKYGARVALYGRKIKDAEHPLAFIGWLRQIADGNIAAEEAVRAYHGDLQKLGIKPRRPIADDMQITATEMSYTR